MKLFICIILLSLSNPIYAQSQHIFIRGRVVDEATLNPLTGASIQCYRSADSTRLRVTRTDENGKYSLDSLPNQNLYLTISFLGYESQVFELQRLQSIQKKFYLRKQNINLAEVRIFGQKNLVTYKKDTISFDATFYRVNDDAMLSTLLKKFPGFSLSVDGRILYNGKIIDKITVEGRTYFGNDIGSALKNLPADLISKIQVINGNSNESMLLGNISNENKILNIEIKDEKKNIVAGQLEGGIGNDNRFNSKILFNKFGDKSNLTTYASGNNLNGYLEGNNGSDQLHRIWESGGTYSQNINKNLSISVSYKFENNRSKNSGTTDRQYFLEDTSYRFIQAINKIENNNSNALAAQFNYKLDSTTEITLKNSVRTERLRLTNNTEYNSLTKSMESINSGMLYNDNLIKNKNYFGSIQLDKKLRKEGRIIKIIADLETGKTNTENLSLTQNIFKDSTGKPLAIQTNQKSTIKEEIPKKRFAIFYNEPLNKGATLGLSAGILIENRPTTKNTFNYDSIQHSYNLIDDSLTLLQKNKKLTTYANIFMQGNIKNWQYTIATRYAFIEMISRRETKTHSSNHFSTFYPSASLKYAFAKTQSISLAYDTRVTTPSFLQLNPVPDNSNPSIVRLSNPNLKNGFAHSFTISYSSQDYFNQKGITVLFNATFGNNQIIEGNQISSTGKQIILPINIDGIQHYSLNTFNEIPIKKNFIQLSLVTNLAYDINAYIPYSIKQNTQNLTLDQSTRLKFILDKFMDLNCGGSIKYTQIKRINSIDNPSQLFGYSLDMDNTIFLPLNFSINMAIVYSSINQQGTNLNSFVTNFAISKEKLLHNKLIIKLYAFDLFNHNTGLRRNIGINYIEDSRSLTFGRSILLDCIFKF